MATVTVQCETCSPDERSEIRRVIEEAFGKDEVLEVRLSRAAAVLTVEYAVEHKATSGPSGPGPKPTPHDVTDRVKKALKASGHQVL
jgi:phage gp16-like protein